MTDIVERLNDAAGDYAQWDKKLGWAAADEIERLRDLLREVAIRADGVHTPSQAIDFAAQVSRVIKMAVDVTTVHPAEVPHE